MNTRIWLCLGVLAVSALLVAQAAPPTTAPASTPTVAAHPSAGVRAAQALSTITGVAISPLLGVSAVGAWKYLHAAAAQRARLPWFAQPWFWIPALVIVSFCFAKDVMGPAVPTVLKKPLDALELFENKLSGLIAAGAFVPIMATLFQAASPEESLRQGLGLAAFDPSVLVNFLTIPLAIFAFALVWMVSHVINVLIVISPFATVDAGLKSVRLFLLSTVTLTSFAHPYWGAVWSLVLIVAAYFLAGWSFRLTVFGNVFAWDLLTLRQKRFVPKPAGNWMFTARKIDQVPVRTYGKLTRSDSGEFVLRYRPLLVLPARTLPLPEGQYALGRGMIFPELMRVEGATTKTYLTLPPRFRSHEETIAQIYALSEVRDLSLVKGYRAFWLWLKSLFGWGSKPMAPTAQPA